MTEWINLINLIVVVFGLAIVMLGLFFSCSVTYLTKDNRQFLSVLFLMLTAYCLSDLVSQLSLTFPPFGNMMVSKAAIFLESFFSSVCMPLMTMYILFCAGSKIRKSPFMISSVAIWCIYFIILVYTQFSRSIYYLTPDNVYNRGPLYPLLLTPPLILMILNLICLYREKESLSSRQFFAFLIYLLLPLICMAVQMFCYGILMIVFGTSLASSIMLLFILREQLDLYIKKLEENASQRLSIMMLEMRPHFIYNTLTSIYYLCEQDSKKAQQVTLDFSVYLRKNFTAISKNSTIPLSEELEHTKAYLAVEMARFEGRLFVEYDFKRPPLFRIPPLTLQPIVENSVKHHGLDPDSDPLRISIRIKEEADGNYIIVEDNGVGFDGSDNNKPHIALDNIRERISLMCNGTLTINYREGGGTVVTIFTPPQLSTPKNNYLAHSLV